MTVYIVTAGSYSDYHIEAVFTDPEKARMYANLDNDREIEEYEADSVDLTYKHSIDHPNCYSVDYNYRDDVINSACLTTFYRDYENKEYVSDYKPVFHFYVNDCENIFNDILQHGNNSPLLKRIAQDRFARYLYEHRTCRVELLCHMQENYEKEKRLYQMFSTASVLPDPERIARKEAGDIVADQLKEIIMNGGKCPSAGDVEFMWNQAYEEVKPKVFKVNGGRLEEDDNGKA